MERDTSLVHLTKMTLFQLIRNWVTKGSSEKWYALSKGRPRVIRYLPEFSSDVNSEEYEDYCRVRVINKTRTLSRQPKDSAHATLPRSRPDSARPGLSRSN